MKALGSFYQLPRHEKRLLISALFLLGTVRVGLWTTSFLRLRVLLEALPKDTFPLRSNLRSDPNRISWAVAKAGHVVPHSTCLSRALAIQAMLRGQDIKSSLNIGVAKAGEQQVVAHAWIECNGSLIECGSNPADYTSLLVSTV